MTNTGGYLPVDAVRKLRQAQPHADLVLMYGLTEAFRSSYLSPDKVDREASFGRAGHTRCRDPGPPGGSHRLFAG